MGNGQRNGGSDAEIYVAVFETLHGFCYLAAKIRYFMMEQELLDLLIQNISYQLRHPQYDRTVEVAKMCRMMTTGKDQDAEIVQYKRFAETLQLQEQRVKLNIPMTPVYISKPGKMFKKMSRVDGVRRDVALASKSEKDKLALQESLWNFQPGVDVESWLVQKIDFLQKNDPNAWILYDRYDRRTATKDILKTDLRPVVFRSVDVLNFGLDVSGIPNWVLFRDTRMEYNVEGGAVRRSHLETYYLYAPEILIIAREAGQKTEIQESETPISIDVLPVVQENVVQEYGKVAAPGIVPSKKTREFYVSTVEHGAGEVPAFCVGAYPDAETDQQSFVSWFWEGMPVLREVIRDQNMHCVHTVLEAFRRRYEFSPVCEYETEDHAQCQSGWIHTGEGRTRCPGCGGSGLRPNFTTEQEVIRLSMPDSMDKVFELSKLAFVEPVDTTLLEYWDKKMEVHKIRFDDAIFGDGMYKKPTGSQQTTATETNERTDMAADILREFGLVVSKGYELAFRALAGYREIGPVMVNHSYPEQIDLLTLEQEIANFAAIQNVDIYEAKVHQRHRIIAKQFEGEPETHRRIAAWYRFLPFDDKSPEATAQIIASLSPTDDNVILWTYWLQIRQEVDAKVPQFHTLSYEQQKTIVNEKVQEFKGRIELAGADVSAEPPNFNTDPNADNNPQPAA